MPTAVQTPGLIVAPLTPFAADLKVDEARLQRQIDYVIKDCRATMIVAAGVETQEYTYLSLVERKDLIRRTIELTDKRVPVMVGDAALCKQISDELIERYCAHRRASLEYGRVEVQGIRCCYHGWKFDRAGKCLETPPEEEGSTLKDRVSMSAYPVQEWGGMVWAYLGPKETQPEFVPPRWAPTAEARVSTRSRKSFSTPAVRPATSGPKRSAITASSSRYFGAANSRPAARAAGSSG